MTIAMASTRAFARVAAARAATAVDTAAIASDAVRCLLLELTTWPKPGLVSHVDAGSHDDMDAGTFRRSAAALMPYFRLLAEAGAVGGDMHDLRCIGVAAEAAMLAATRGVNTHRGAIFGLGLLCAAAGARHTVRGRRARTLGAIVRHYWGPEIFAEAGPLHTHGGGARLRYGAGGARAEAAAGFSAIYRVGLPALHAARRVAGRDAEAQRVHACFALIAAVEDTNLLHRGGAEGLRFAQAEARRFMNDGGVGAPGWRARARDVHDAFVARRLSPGGAADLLAMTLFVDTLEGQQA